MARTRSLNLDLVAGNKATTLRRYKLNQLILTRLGDKLQEKLSSEKQRLLTYIR